MTKLLSILFCLMLAGAGYATDTYVGTASALTSAVAGASSGDRVLCSNGTYNVNLIVPAGVTVRSISGLPGDVILDGGAAGRVITNSATSWLIGLTIQNGYFIKAEGETNEPGAGVCGGSVSNCVIQNNVFDGVGSQYGAGAAYATIYNCTVKNNSCVAGGAIGLYYCTAYNCLITGNTGVELATGAYMSTLRNCTIVGNTGVGGNGGTMNCDLIGCISLNDEGAAIDINPSNSYSCGVGYTGTGSITNNPLFISASDFRLANNSPCLNTGTNGAWTTGTDLDGNPRIFNGTVDMGCYERQYGLLLIGGTGTGAMGGTGTGNVRGRVMP